MYILQEIQTSNNTPAFLPPVVRDTRPDIESAFYLTCGSACISAVEKHTVMVYTEEGFPIPELTKCFIHEPQEEIEPNLNEQE